MKQAGGNTGEQNLPTDRTSIAPPVAGQTKHSGILLFDSSISVVLVSGYVSRSHRRTISPADVNETDPAKVDELLSSSGGNEGSDRERYTVTKRGTGSPTLDGHGTKCLRGEMKLHRIASDREGSKYYLDFGKMGSASGCEEGLARRPLLAQIGSDDACCQLRVSLSPFVDGNIVRRERSTALWRPLQALNFPFLAIEGHYQQLVGRGNTPCERPTRSPSWPMQDRGLLPR